MKHKSFTLKINYKGFLLNGKPISGMIKVFNRKCNNITRQEVIELLNKEYNNEVNDYKTIIKVEDITNYSK